MITQEKLNNDYESLKRMVAVIPSHVSRQLIEHAKKTITDPKLTELEKLIK